MVENALTLLMLSASCLFLALAIMVLSLAARFNRKDKEKD
jgi:hypothetical protein